MEDGKESVLSKALRKNPVLTSMPKNGVVVSDLSSRLSSSSGVKSLGEPKNTTKLFNLI